MQIFDWNKMSSKDKLKLGKQARLAFIAGPVQMSSKRLNQIIKDVSAEFLIFGCLKDSEIPGLEFCPQFASLKLKKLVRSLKGRQKIGILQHFHKDIKYIISELKPSRVIFINGSWSGPIHYKREYWKAVDIQAKISLVSPVSEQEAKVYERMINNKRQAVDSLYKKKLAYTDSELIEMAWKAAEYSWDWVGRIGAVLAKNGCVLAIAWNRVVPYEAYQLYAGSPREARQIPSQERLELHLTNHAECEILEIVRREKIDIKGTSLYINLFPCPFCAKVLSRTEIAEVVYSQDYSEDMGYRILEMSGKKLKRLLSKAV